MLLVCVAGALAAAALMGVAWFSVGLERTLTALAHPNWPWLAAALGGEVLAYAGYTAAYREVACAEDGAELEVSKAAALVASGFGAFVHGGGFSLDRAALQRVGLSAEEAHRRVLALGALEYAVLAPATAVAALLVLVWHHSIGKSLTLPWIVGVPTGAVLTLAALRFEEAARRLPLLGGPLGRGLHALRLVLRFVTAPLRHVQALGGTLVYWAGDVFCLWATLHAFALRTPPVPQLLVAYATGYALTRRALPLGGAGVVEALMPFALGWLEIARAPALVAVFVYRLFNLWLPLIPAAAGLPTVRQLEHAGLRARRRRRS